MVKQKNFIISIAAFFLNLIPILKSTVKNSDDDIVKIIVGIFLHDTYEDYTESLLCFSKQFPEYVLLVKRSSKVQYMLEEHIKISDEEYYKKLHTDPIAILIKSIDRIHNLSTIKVLGQEKVLKYVKHTEEFVLPMIKLGRKEYFEYNILFEYLKQILNIICQILK